MIVNDSAMEAILEVRKKSSEILLHYLLLKTGEVHLILFLILLYNIYLMFGYQGT